MPHEGFADPSVNDGPGFHMNMPVCELIEHDTQAIEASVVSSAPSVVETEDRVTRSVSSLTGMSEWNLGPSFVTGSA